MKKLLFRGAFALMTVVALASCKKDYTCTCTTVTPDPMGGADISASVSTTINGKKNDVKEACEAGSISVMGSSVTCVID